MQAQHIIQDLLSTECPSIHAKRRTCLAVTVQAGTKGSVSLMGMNQALSNTTAIRHRIKRCDRLLGNSKLEAERHVIYVGPTNIATTRVYDWRKTRPQDRPTVKVSY
jgi:hypothetical protein